MIGGFAAATVRLSRRLTPVGRERLRAALAEAITGHGTLIALLEAASRKALLPLKDEDILMTTPEAARITPRMIGTDWLSFLFWMPALEKNLLPSDSDMKVPRKYVRPRGPFS